MPFSLGKVPAVATLGMMEKKETQRISQGLEEAPIS